MKCKVCNNTMNQDDTKSFLTQFLSKKELDKIQLDCICHNCKKDRLVFNLMGKRSYNV